MGTRVKTAAMAAAMLATMVGTAPAHAATPMQRLAKRVAKLERANTNRLRENRALQAQLAGDEDALAFSLGLLSCFSVDGAQPMPANAFLSNPPAFDFWLVDGSNSPSVWFASVDPSCVDTGNTASVRARAFRRYFRVARP